VRELNLNGSWEFVGSYDGAVGCSAFMRTLDVFVLPSFAEGTSKSVIEAMAHGLPIIATNVGGLPDLLTPDAGILVSPGDSAALADAMQRLAVDPVLRKRMGQAAREQYLKLFAPNAVLSMLVGTYSRVTGRNGHLVQNSHPWAAGAENQEQTGSISAAAGR
jgi:glycosyltransferase involved in cell wall biosynthesis